MTALDSHTGGHISTEPRINDRIRVPEVRLVGPNGEQVGIVRVEDAIRLATENDLDLVEVAPMARPPVCKLMDYGKFKYEAAQKARDARKNQTNTLTKEMKLRLKIDNHDYETKKGHVVRFLEAGSKVKVTIMFRGREVAHPELGKKILDRVAEEIINTGRVEVYPKLDGPRNMIMVLAPDKKAQAAYTAELKKAAEEAQAASTATDEAAEVTAPVADAAPEAPVEVVEDIPEATDEVVEPEPEAEVVETEATEPEPEAEPEA